MTFRTLRIAAVVCLLATPTLAQKPDFAPFWSEFSAAAKAGDKAKVRALTKFPFLHHSDLHEEKAFDAIWKDAFTAKARACLGKGKPAWDKKGNLYVLFCGQIGFYFESTGAGWLRSFLHTRRTRLPWKRWRSPSPRRWTAPLRPVRSAPLANTL